MRKPSQHSVDLYNQLVKKQNAVRRILKKIHKDAGDALGVGRLPSLVLPKRVKKVNYSTNINAKVFWRKYKEAQTLFAGQRGGLNTYLGKTLKQGYLETIRDWIDAKPASFYNSRTQKEQTGVYYTLEQMNSADEVTAKAMKVYNAYVRTPAIVFLGMLYVGAITPLKFIYDELRYGFGGKNAFNDKENSYLQQQIESFENYASGKNMIKFISKLGEVSEVFKEVIPNGSVKHRTSTIAKAELLQAKDELKGKR